MRTYSLPVRTVPARGSSPGICMRCLGALRKRWSRSTSAVCPKERSTVSSFGHVNGAYTDAKADRVGRFELADGGTLFLDEIANVPHSQQRKLLARSRDRGLRARRLVEDETCRRPDPFGHEFGPQSRSGGGTLSTGPVVSAQHDRDLLAAASRSTLGTSSLSRRRFLSATDGTTARISRASTTKRSRRSRILPGLATSESSTTRSSAPC